MLFEPIPASLYHRAPAAADARVSLRYLGTAGFVVEGAGRTLVLDPYVSRPGLLQTAFSPLVPDEARIARVIPKADDVLIGHAHFDHILDAPPLCRRTGARFIGSPDACNVARAGGVEAAQIVETRGREDIACGGATVRGIPSVHGKAILGRIPLPGPIPVPPAWPPRYGALRHGLVLNWSLDVAGVRVVHVDSADYLDAEIEGLRADVVCLCAIGRKYRPRYVEGIVGLLKPRWVVACHWDWFFDPYDAPPRGIPGVDLPGFVDEVRAAGAEPIVLPFDGVFCV